MRMNEAGDVTCCHVLSRGIGTCQGGLSFPNPSSYPCLSAKSASKNIENCKSLRDLSEVHFEEIAN